MAPTGPGRGLIDGETSVAKGSSHRARKRRLERPPRWRHLLARLLDTAAVLALGIPVLVAAAGPLLERFPGAFDLTDGAESAAVLVPLSLMWCGLLFAYGALCGTTGGLGDRLCGIRAVRIEDGIRPGPWRGGLRAVLWSFVPAVVLIALLSFFDDAPTGSSGDFVGFSYRVIDVRKGRRRSRKLAHSAGRTHPAP
ncbi:hypothetical protein GCM10023081_37380 [Arthrobacter ginkgonis]|uniref:RDD domain-containing protein n=1 Tax=Arthrobacter ginkgonis TaxID=1630594 RepID=A0ABP7CZH0_9MICC